MFKPIPSCAAFVALLALAASVAAAQSVTIIEPNGGETFTAGVSNVTISWLEAGLDSDDELEVEFTVDGTNWRRVDRVGPDIRTVSWIPDRSGTSARVRVTSKNNGSVTDMSDGTFVINQDPNDITAVITPNGGEVWQMGETRTIAWQAPADAVNVLLELSTNGGSSWTQIATVPATTTQYSWMIPSLGEQDITTALVRVSVAEAIDHFDVSNAPFTLRARPRAVLTLIAPNGGERYRVDSATTVRWTTQNLPQDGPEVRVEYSADSGRTWAFIATEDATGGSHSWIVPRRPTRFALVRVVAATGPLGDTSNAVFEIYADSVSNPPVDTTGTDSIRITEPREGDAWREGEYQRIAWTSSVTDDSVVVTAIVRSENGDLRSPIEIAALPIANGATTWIVPRLEDSLAEARFVIRLLNSGVADTSGAVTIRHKPAVARVDGDIAEADALRISPNPATDRIELRLAGDGRESARIVAADGRIVRTVEIDGGTTAVPLAGLAAGSYVVEVERAGLRMRARFVVVR